MAIMDILIGERGLRKVRDRSVEFARKMYDPTVLDPARTIAAARAVEGINEDPYRRDALQSIYRDPGDMAIYGGNQAAAIAGVASVDASRAEAVGQFETRLAMADMEAMERGEDRLAQVMGEQRNIQAMQEAAIKEADIMYEAERSARKYELGGALGTLGGVFAMTPVGQKTLSRLGNFVESMFTPQTGPAFVEGMEDPQARLAQLKGMVQKPNSQVMANLSEGRGLDIQGRIDAMRNDVTDLKDYIPRTARPRGTARRAQSQAQPQSEQPKAEAPMQPIDLRDPRQWLGYPTGMEKDASGRGFRISGQQETPRRNPLREFFGIPDEDPYIDRLTKNYPLNSSARRN